MADTWRNRIVGHGEENPEQLLANPDNWRIHPKAQQEAMAGALGQVGWVQSVIVNRNTGNVVDGHLRVALAISKRAATVPVVYVDLTPDEERAVLATFDPISGMAVSDRAKLTELLETVDVPDAALVDMLDDVRSRFAEVKTTDPVEFKGDFVDSGGNLAMREARAADYRVLKEIRIMLEPGEYKEASALVEKLRKAWGLTRLSEVFLKALAEAAK